MLGAVLLLLPLVTDYKFDSSTLECKLVSPINDYPSISDVASYSLKTFCLSLNIQLPELLAGHKSESDCVWSE